MYNARSKIENASSGIQVLQKSELSSLYESLTSFKEQIKIF